jgi:hypothetical protein
MNDAATRETNRKCFVVGVAKLDKTRLIVAAQYLERFCNHCALDAAATHRANNFAIFIDSHCCAGVAWSRTFNVDDASNSNLFARLLPALDVIE